MEELSNDVLRSALISKSGDIYDFYDVQKFLSHRDFSKSIGQRFLSWLIRLGIIPAARSEWVNKIQQKYTSYQTLCHSFFKTDINEPLKALAQESGHTIHVDILRTYPWFIKLITDLGVSESRLEGVDIQAKRILAVIGLENKDLSYTQGHDRYVWITLIVSIIFALEGGLPMSFAEAMSFYMSRAFIMINPISGDIENFSKIEAHFSVLDELVDSEVPQTSALLKKVGHTSMHYALKWELTLFSDEHTINELMMLWDEILAHSDDIVDYVRCICIAHIKQVPCTEMADEMAQAIQRYRNWNVPKILDDANALLNSIIGDVSFVERVRMQCFNYCGNCYMQ